SIYPNPAKGMVNVSVEGKANFQLFNISGQSVMNMDIKGTTSVDISSLNSGMYFSRITSETGATKTLKLQVK
ncbi:MAG: T9SS type A sorting domain-containing protein, partial [Flavobacteriales bacterium]|nr:T9SS type A sorting domain-containing protein [Flavobacteriales bacterium]